VNFQREVVKGEHDGIISRSVWERVREITSSQVPYDHSRGIAELTVPLKGILRCGHCGCSMKPVFTNKGKKRYCYYYCNKDTKRGEKTCPVGKIGSATIENTVRDQARKIFQSPYFLERISAQTGLTIPEVRSYFNEDFWAETNPAELNRIYSELFEKIILKEDQIVFEIKTAGIQALTEEVLNEHQ
jgi:site-specific DNA recombinase